MTPTPATNLDKTTAEPMAMEVDSAPKLVIDAEALFLADVKNNILLLEKAVVDFEPRFVTRVLRSTPSVRKRLTPQFLARALVQYLVTESAIRTKTLPLLGDVDVSDAMVVDSDTSTSDASKLIRPSALPEVEVYLGLLAIVFLHDKKRYKEGAELTGRVVDLIQTANRRTLDALGAKVYFYYARFHEVQGLDAQVRPKLLALYRTASLRQDEESNATLLNLILRSLLRVNQIDQADKLVAKSGGLPETASNVQAVRYHYYVGRIAALQLDYTGAHAALQQAIRKAPAGPATLGFVQAATKLAILVQLLMGEVPDRSTFRPVHIRRPLETYRQLVLTVRQGDLPSFTKAVAQGEPTFTHDGTLTLVHRLRHNVIKTGLRLLSVAYSAISLRDICLRLGLDSEESAEYIVAKAIRDGVLATAKIDHVAGVVRSDAAEALADVYASREPQLSFHSRIKFGLELHNASVKAMRYPDRVKSAAFADSEEVRELEKEIQQALEDDVEEF